ncbi:MAG: PqqD family protein [Acidobacteriota bacterium]|nr:PqqD family protein [Acidobacteriota bacterium]
MRDRRPDSSRRGADGDRVRVPDHVLVQETDDECVLLNLESEFYLGLNESGTRMFTELRRAGSVEVAYEALCEVYDVDRDRLRDELERFVEKLERQGLLEMLEPSDEREGE